MRESTQYQHIWLCRLCDCEWDAFSADPWAAKLAAIEGELEMLRFLSQCSGVMLTIGVG